MTTRCAEIKSGLPPASVQTRDCECYMFCICFCTFADVARVRLRDAALKSGLFKESPESSTAQAGHDHVILHVGRWRLCALPPQLRGGRGLLQVSHNILSVCAKRVNHHWTRFHFTMVSRGRVLCFSNRTPRHGLARFHFTILPRSKLLYFYNRSPRRRKVDVPLYDSAASQSLTFLQSKPPSS